MIDLHSHTNQSDGTDLPLELLAKAKQLGIDTLSITDHDTFGGYEIAAPAASAMGIRLICGIELSLKLDGKSVHVLGYFPDPGTVGGFRAWIVELQNSRRARNEGLIQRLQSMGVDITLAEVQAGRGGLAGRPQFAQLLVQKGYAQTIQQAFDVYLAEGASAYVDRLEPTFQEGVTRIRDAGGIASLAHPIRIKGDLEPLMPRLCDWGLNAIEVWHSDHGPAEVAAYEDFSARYGLLATGGSDYHGATKPNIELGTGRNGNLAIPKGLVDSWRLVAPV